MPGSHSHGEEVNVLQSLELSPVPSDVLDASCIEEPLLLLTRAVHKTKTIFGLEMRSAGLRSGLCGDSAPRECERGLWCVPGSTEAGGSATSSRQTPHAAFRSLLPSMASVRRVLRPLVIADSIQALGAQLEKLALEPASWSLSVETFFQSPDQDVMPWVVDTTTPALTITVARALRRGLETYTMEAGGEITHTKLVLISGKRGLALCVERQGIVGGEHSVNAWAQHWRERAHSSNVSTDPEVAIAIANIALNAAAMHRADSGVNVEHGAEVGSQQELRLLDPCTGGGTLAAAARRLGVHSIWACDVRPDAVIRSHGNWASMGFASRDVLLGGEVLASTPNVSEPTQLADDQIWGLVKKRLEARESKDYAAADALRDDLVAGGVWTNDKCRFWYARDGRYGKLDGIERNYEDLAPKLNARPSSQTAETLGDPFVGFYHDGTRPYPEWLRVNAPHVDMVVANPPWGNKIGGKEDGHRIVERICTTFFESVLCLFVSAACFTSLCEPMRSNSTSGEDDKWEWKLSDTSVPLPEMDGVECDERIRSWRLLWHADVSFATLMVLVPKKTG